MYHTQEKTVPSKRSWRKNRGARAAARLARSTNSVQTPQDAQGATGQSKGKNILKEDIGKLHDPLFFSDHAETALPGKLTFLLFCKEIRTIGNLCDKTEADLLTIPRFGERSLEKVNRTLRALGLKLKE